MMFAALPLGLLVVGCWFLLAAVFLLLFAAAVGKDEDE